MRRGNTRMLYLDNSATTIPYPEVLSTYIKVTEEYFANPSSIHKLGSEAEALLNHSRKQVASLLDVDQQEIIFTSGGTEGNNLAIKGAAFANRHKGRHIITSTIEHPSVIEAFKQLEQFHGFDVSYLPVDEDGIVSLEHLEKAIRDDTILLSIMHVNNEVGTIQPITEIGQIIKKNRNTLFHVDNVQGITKVPLDLKKANIDLCTISGHKFHGLNGSGVLYKRTGVDLLPLFSGGSQELQMRSGTESLASNVAFAKALRMATEKAAKRRGYLVNIHEQLRGKLMNLEGVVVNTPLNNAAPHIINFSVPAVKAEVLIHFLGEHDIYVSTTSACSSRSKTSSKTLLAMNKNPEIAKSAIRVSLSYESNEEMIHTFLDTLSKGIEKLTKIMR
jgi:cysteine desulfurase